MDNSVDNGINNTNVNNVNDNIVDLKGLSTAFKTVHERSVDKNVKLLKNRKKVKQTNKIVDNVAKKKSKIIKKHRESIRKKPSEYDIKDEQMLKSIAKKGVINALKTIYETQSF